MIANYHTHTERCHHAFGTDKEFVEAAYAAGIRELGFSDHVPYPETEDRPENHYRVFKADIPGYFSSIAELKREYSGRMKIYGGFESEYFPNAFDRNLEYLRDSGLEYLILGQHFCDEYQTMGSFTETADEQELDRYVFSVIEGIRSGKFTYVAHPDVKNFVGDRRYYERRMLELCYAAADRDIPLEFNLLGFAAKKHYPNDTFFGLASKIGNKVILGVDAHVPAFFDNAKLFADAKEHLASLGITPIDRVDIVDPFR